MNVRRHGGTERRISVRRRRADNHVLGGSWLEHQIERHAARVKAGRGSGVMVDQKRGRSGSGQTCATTKTNEITNAKITNETINTKIMQQLAITTLVNVTLHLINA